MQVVFLKHIRQYSAPIQQYAVPSAARMERPQIDFSSVYNRLELAQFTRTDTLGLPALWIIDKYMQRSADEYTPYTQLACTLHLSFIQNGRLPNEMEGGIWRVQPAFQPYHVGQNAGWTRRSTDVCQYLPPCMSYTYWLDRLDLSGGVLRCHDMQCTFTNIILPHTCAHARACLLFLSS